MKKINNGYHFVLKTSTHSIMNVPSTKVWRCETNKKNKVWRRI